MRRDCDACNANEAAAGFSSLASPLPAVYQTGPCCPSNQRAVETYLRCLCPSIVARARPLLYPDDLPRAPLLLFSACQKEQCGENPRNTYAEHIMPLINMGTGGGRGARNKRRAAHGKNVGALPPGVGAQGSCLQDRKSRGSFVCLLEALGFQPVPPSVPLLLLCLCSASSAA